MTTDTVPQTVLFPDLFDKPLFAKRVDVASVFLDGGVLRQRVFQFSTAGVTGQDVTDAPKDAKRQTTVSLRGFDAGYRTKTRKTAEAIAKAMLEHCLWHFVREGGCPRIVLEDDGEQIRLDEVFDQHMHSSAVRQQAILKDRRFDLLHVKLRTSAATRHAIAYCANNRLVLEEGLEGRLPGLHGNLDDEEGEFAYVCYVSSQILDELGADFAGVPERDGCVSYRCYRAALHQSCRSHLCDDARNCRKIIRTVSGPGRCKRSCRRALSCVTVATTAS